MNYKLIAVTMGVALHAGTAQAVCDRPSTAGYDFTNVAETALTQGASFDVTGVACATGFHGSASATTCATDATDYVVQGCTANPTCDDTDTNGADFAACGSGFTIKSVLTNTCATDTCQVSDCCTANPTCDDTDSNGADFAACGSGFTINSVLTNTCATDTCQVTDCCTANACTAKADAAAWEAVGVTVDTAGATTVTGLGTIGTAAGWTGSASVTCPTANQAFDVTGVSAVSGKCSGNAATATGLAEEAGDGTFQFACGSGYTVKASTVALSGSTDAEKKAACCSPVDCSNTNGTAWVTAACVCEGGAAITAEPATCAPAESATNAACAAANTDETACTAATSGNNACEFTAAVSAADAGAPCTVENGGKCTAGAAGADATCAAAPLPATTAAATTAAATTAKPALNAGSEDSAATATLGVASALAAAAAFARLL